MVRPQKPPADAQAHAPAWSPETETREEVKALLRCRSALSQSEMVVYRSIYPDFYDTYVDTLLCVVRGRGAKEDIARDLVHDALLVFWDETVASGFPESIQAKLVSLASGRAWNHVRHEARNPAPHDMPRSSQQLPGSAPTPERASDLKELAELARLFFSALCPNHQAAVDAVIFRDLTIAAAARELGLPPSTVASRLTAALALLLAMAEELLSPSERTV